MLAMAPMMPLKAGVTRRTHPPDLPDRLIGPARRAHWTRRTRRTRSPVPADPLTGPSGAAGPAHWSTRRTHSLVPPDPLSGPATPASPADRYRRTRLLDPPDPPSGPAGPAPVGPAHCFQTCSPASQDPLTGSAGPSAPAHRSRRTRSPVPQDPLTGLAGPAHRTCPTRLLDLAAYRTHWTRRTSGSI
jgi:hypothetical protein